MKQERNTDPNSLALQILKSRKYRELNIPVGTVRDLIQHAVDNGMKPAKAVDEARGKLHNIVAPYLGDPDYKSATDFLRNFSASPNPPGAPVGTSSMAEPACTAPPSGADIEAEPNEALQNFCMQMLESHASTRERIPQLNDFYTQIFQITGQPHSILDLACAMHPFGIPWMNLPPDCEYSAYDLHQPRVDLINFFFQTCPISGQAYYGDVLIRTPQQTADIAFFFKEAHRFDQRQKGCNRDFWMALNVKWLVVSLPAANLTGTYNLTEKHRKLVYDTLVGCKWPITEKQIGNELLFFLHKNAGSK